MDHGGVGLTHQQVSVALHRGDIAQLAAALAFAGSVRAKADAFGLEQGLIEGGGVQTLGAILLAAHLAAAAHADYNGSVPSLRIAR